MSCSVGIGPEVPWIRRPVHGLLLRPLRTPQVMRTQFELSASHIGFVMSFAASCSVLVNSFVVPWALKLFKGVLCAWEVPCQTAQSVLSSPRIIPLNAGLRVREHR